MRYSSHTQRRALDEVGGDVVGYLCLGGSGGCGRGSDVASA